MEITWSRKLRCYLSLDDQGYSLGMGAQHIEAKEEPQCFRRPQETREKQQDKYHQTQTG